MRPRVAPMVDRLCLPKGLCLLDTEEKMLRAVEFLYPIVRKAPGFKDNTRWSANTTVDEVLNNLLQHQHHYFEKQHMEFTMSESDDGFYLDMSVPVWMRGEISSVPVYFLPVLENVHHGLFVFLFYLASYLHRSGVPFVNDAIDYEDGWMYERLMEDLAHLKTNRRQSGEDDARIQQLEASLSNYSKTGEATRFFNRIRGAGASPKKWIAEFDAWKPNLKIPFMKAAYNILSAGRTLMSFPKDSLNNYSILPEEYRGREEDYDELPVLPHEYINMVWKLDDPWFEEYFSMKRDEMGNQGAVPMSREMKVKTWEDLRASNEDNFASVLTDVIYHWVAFDQRFRHILKDATRLKTELNKNMKSLIEIL